MNLSVLRSLWSDLANNPRYNRYIGVNDIQSFNRQAESEGLPFLTSSLPLIGKWLDATFHSDGRRLASLSEVRADPMFLGDAIELARKGDPTAVECVRQLTYMFYKLEVPHDDRFVQAFLDNFIAVDRDVACHSSRLRSCAARSLFGVRGSSDGLSPFIMKGMRSLICRVLANTDPHDIFPLHGPGATSDHVPNWLKYRKFRFIPRLDATYPYDRFFFLNASHLCDELEKLSQSTVIEDPKARVCLVPKDSRGPRVISCEPTEFMFIQQGLMGLLYRTIENHPLTSGQVLFTDQSVHKTLARVGSITDQLATLDLKDASDRVSLDLVRLVFPPNWVECFEACRSRVTVLPDGREVELSKFAPMGSSCCFPVEALVFWACAQAVLACHNIRKRCVYVYGDDIVCDSDISELIIRGLTEIGLVVNIDKSYVSGPFRESCGGDYFLGENVTPVRLRKEISPVGTGPQAAADFINQLVDRFGYESIHSVIRVIESKVGLVFPRTLEDVPLAIRTETCAVNDVMFKTRWNKDLQRTEHRLPSLHLPVKEMAPADWSELLRFQLRKREERLATVQEYSNSVTKAERSVLPGQYAVPRAVQKSWTWKNLG